MTKDPNSQTIDTYNKIAKNYAQRSLKKNWITDELDAFISKIDKGSKVLELGCGSGRDAKYLYDHGIDILATDYSEAFLLEVNDRFPEIVTQQVDMRDLPFKDKIFDGVMANASVLHIEKKDIPQTFAGFFRVLKTNGLLMMLVKEGEGEAFVKEERSLGNERFFSYFQEEELKNLLEIGGFYIEDLYSFSERDKKENARDINWIVVFARKK